MSQLDDETEVHVSVYAKGMEEPVVSVYLSPTHTLRMTGEAAKRLGDMLVDAARKTRALKGES